VVQAKFPFALGIPAASALATHAPVCVHPEVLCKRMWALVTVFTPKTEESVAVVTLLAREHRTRLCGGPGARRELVVPKRSRPRCRRTTACSPILRTSSSRR
jgi:hypothetical protein